METTQQIPSVAPSYDTFDQEKKKVAIVIVSIHARIKRTEVVVSTILSLNLTLWKKKKLL